MRESLCNSRHPSFRFYSPSRPVSLYSVLQSSSAAMDMVSPRPSSTPVDSTLAAQQHSSSAFAASAPAPAGRAGDSPNVTSPPLQLEDKVQKSGDFHINVAALVFGCALA
jgi:hypothetical protein